MSDTLKLANSIWPNGMKVDSDGHAVFYPLGTNKVDVPTNSPQWPKGDKLVSPFVYQDDKLVGFCDTKAMVGVDGSTIIMPYEHIEVDFSSIEKDSIQIHAPKATTKTVIWKNSNKEDIADVNYKYKGCTTVNEITAVDENYMTTDVVDGTWNEILSDLQNSRGMFDSCTALITFNSDLSSLKSAASMFRGCTNLIEFYSDLSSLTSANSMFEGCSSLTTFTSDLSSLQAAVDMFSNCTSLTTFTSDLSSLTSVSAMFYNCSSLTTFTSDLSSLTNGGYMFRSCTALTTFNSDLSSLQAAVDMFRDCTNLTTFTSDLRNLRDAGTLDNGGMFAGCSKLTTFKSNLSLLQYGLGMFKECSLNTESIACIAETIQDVNHLTSNTQNDGYAVLKVIHIGIGNSTPNEQEEAAFNTMVSKGWTVYVNGSSSSDMWNPTSLIPIDGEEITTTIPFLAKPVPSDEEHAQYTDAQGNFFNILGGQFIYGDDISTYGMFTCEEDAAANMRLTPYIKPQTEIENQ